MPLGNKPEPAGTSSPLKHIFNFQQWGILLVLLALIIILGITVPVFLSPRNIRNVLQQVATLGIVSLGMTILMISGGIDLSVGSSISVTAVIVGSLLKAGAPVLPIIILGLAVGSCMGLINGTLAAFTKAHPFILTLGTMTLFQGLAIIVTGGFPITDLGKKFEFLGGGMIWGVLPLIVIIFFVVLLCGFCAGLASLVLSSRISSAIPNMGTGFELNSIAAVVIGGTPLMGGKGNVWGTLTGVLLLGIIANGLNLLHVEGSWQYVVTGIIIIIAVIMHQSRQK